MELQRYYNGITMVLQWYYILISQVAADSKHIESEIFGKFHL